MPTVIYDHNIDLNLTNQILNARLQNLTDAQMVALGNTLTPANTGLIIYNTDKSRLFTWSGTSWDDYAALGYVTSFKGRTGAVMPTNGDYHITMISGFPDQSGNNNKFLTTSGSSLSWGTLPAAFTVEDAQDAVGYILNSQEFVYSDTTPLISINHIDWSKVTNAPSFLLTETDPTVPAHVKSIEIGTQPNQYLGWSGTQWIKRVISYSEISGLPVIPTQYTNEMAQDTVASMLLTGDHEGLNYTYDDTLNKFNIIVDNAGWKEMRFVVGDSGAPVEDGTSFLLVDENGDVLTNVKIDFYRERDLQFPGVDYTYDPSTSVVNVTIPFITGEKCIVKIYKISAWTEYSVSTLPPTGTGFPYTLPIILL